MDFNQIKNLYPILSQRVGLTDAVVFCVQRDDFDLFQVLINLAGCKENTRLIRSAFRTAVQNGRPSVVEYLQENNDLDTVVEFNYGPEFKTACRYGHIEVAKLLMTRTYICHKFVFMAFVRSVCTGHLSITTWLWHHIINYKCIDRHTIDNILNKAFIAACQYNRESIAEYLTTLTHKENAYELATICCDHNKTNLLEYVIEYWNIDYLRMPLWYRIRVEKIINRQQYSNYRIKSAKKIEN